MKETSAVKLPLFKGRAVALFSFWILIFSIAAFAFGAHQEPVDMKMDYSMTQQDIRRFEDAINDVINSTFSASPIVVVQTAKGAYTGYGISLFFRVNVHRAIINTPFGQVRSRADISPEMKMKRIEELKEKLIRAIQDNGNNFRQLRKEDSVTIVGFFEDRNFPDEPNANKTIVMSVFKKDLDELGRKNDRLKEFRQRMKIVEY